MIINEETKEDDDWSNRAYRLVLSIGGNELIASCLSLEKEKMGLRF